ncbi:glycosyltransferase family 1 protein [Polaribacter sp. WD7]|uniref:glycosyltransferase n=1 Tax=Polaribacter sp. WD7 TaxID=2269061 RepID=UPI000DF4297A|nr:glycosyltransferase [Polaribacter sp. WD7]RCS27055.1 glycosyltransferase family 1 protein [Polaribacter sp. WD7]
MRFLIVTHAIHKSVENKIFSYEPYVREMNLWGKYVKNIKIVSPVSQESISSIESSYTHKNIILSKVPKFNILNTYDILKTTFKIPVICIQIFKGMLWADHIHLRCPGNIALLGCFIQVLFPFKPKTIKYAGNWDPDSKQPLSYRVQKKILANTFLTRNCKVLVYGEWPNQSKNIIPFFTASYTVNEIESIHKKGLSKRIHFIYVGSFSEGKQPLLSVKTIENLIKNGYDVQLDMYGNGQKFIEVKNYIAKKSLEKNIVLHGNQTKEIVKEAFKKSHFLIFISKSEGWPKVVAEAMFWKCLPICSNVSCVSYMLNDGKRGTVLNSNSNACQVENAIIEYLKDETLYQKKVMNAQKWSQKYTLDTFEHEIKKMINIE